MINWELPHEKVACPHCASTETELSLELLGLFRYSCNSCRKSFAIHGDTKPKTIATDSSTPASPEESASPEASESRRA
jgi:transposase-like protein